MAKILRDHPDRSLSELVDLTFEFGLHSFIRLVGSAGQVLRRGNDHPLTNGEIHAA